MKEIGFIGRIYIIYRLIIINKIESIADAIQTIYLKAKSSIL